MNTTTDVATTPATLRRRSSIYTIYADATVDHLVELAAVHHIPLCGTGTGRFGESYVQIRAASDREATQLAATIAAGQNHDLWAGLGTHRRLVCGTLSDPR
jgi:hypothetical protein